MAENIACAPEGTAGGSIREAVCIDTNRVYDSCADKDCLSDLRVYFTDTAQAVIDAAGSVRCRKSEIINAFIDVEAVPFNRGFYSVDITFFFKITLDAYSAPINPPVTVEGLASFSKKCILYGSDGNVKVFSSEYRPDEMDDQLVSVNTNPKARVQVVDPVCLEARICEPRNCCDSCCSIPRCVCRCFDGSFNTIACKREVYVTLGLFTIIQLERDVQMLIPAYDYCIPEKECSCDTDDPCDVFKKIKFPVDEFFPPKEHDGCGCGCGCAAADFGGCDK